MSLSELFREGACVSARDLRGVRIHLIGVGGSGMAGLAAILSRCGARVSGTDRARSAATDRLTTDGLKIGYEGDRILPGADAELIVASAAIPASHPELRRAAQSGQRVLKYAQMLGVLMRCFEGVAISGTHGKSTTTAWLSYALRRAGLDPNFVIGAEVGQLDGGSGVGNGRHFVVEACEYDRSFLNLHPHRAVILNVDEDHLDCYANLADIESAFRAFAGQVQPDGLLVLNAENPSCRRLRDDVTGRCETFGEVESADWRATGLHLDRGTYRFDVVYRGTPKGRVRLGLAGRHNVHNALAVAALATDCGLKWGDIAPALESFTGARRRLEVRHEAADAPRVLDDYAHHPAEIRATLRAARERYEPHKLWCVFQPHQHSRTRFLLEDFAQSFADADVVIVPDIYFVRDSERDRQAVNASDLVERIRARGADARYIPDFDEIQKLIRAATTPDDVVITMGAGNIWEVADGLVRTLRRDS